MLIGIGEAAIATLVIAAVAGVRPELLRESAPPEGRPRYAELAAYGLLVSLGLAVFVAPFASGWPDGLERVAAALGFEATARVPLLAAPLPEYVVPGLGSAVSSTVIAGSVGTLLAFSLAYLLARLLTPPGDAARRGSPRGGAPRASAAA